MSKKPTTVPYWRLSSFYFFYYASLGIFLPYWTLYLKTEGFNALEIGELFALVMATKIIGPNLFGFIADHTGKNFKIIRLLSFFTAFLFIGFFFKTGYLWFAIITVGFSFFWNTVLPQFETVTLFHLHDEAHRYSRIRLWGSVGFVTVVAITGQLLDDLSLTILPIILMGLFVITWFCTLLTPKVSVAHDPVEEGHGLWKIIKKPEVITFFIVYILFHLAHGPYYVFYSISLKELDYPSSFIGGLWAIGMISEVFIYIFMHNILARFSLRSVLLWSALFGMLRWLIIAFASDSIYWLIGAQLLNAVSFSTAHIVGIHLVHQYFGRKHQSKGQAFYVSISFGIGGMLGGLLSGYYWDDFGAMIIYSASAGCCLLAFILSYFFIERKTQHFYKERDISIDLN
jgi:PPP family 3-phenylpropionic acid transporter